MATVNNIDFDQLADVYAANDTILVLVPRIKEETESGLFKGEATVKAEAKELKDDMYVASVGALVQDKSIAVGDKILVNGQVTILPEHVAVCPLVDFQYGAVKGYYVLVTIKS